MTFHYCGKCHQELFWVSLGGEEVDGGMGLWSPKPGSTGLDCLLCPDGGLHSLLTTSTDKMVSELEMIVEDLNGA